MCGRFTLAPTPDDLAETFGLSGIPDMVPRYNIAPSQPVAIIRYNPDGHRRHLSFARWGLIPSWAKNSTGGPHPINARAETAAEKSTFREALKSRRCLIPADGFYEWAKAGSKKTPVRFTMADSHVFAFAGLWDHWERPDGAAIESCTILTTTPNELVASVHNRMPAILRPEAYPYWLDPTVTSTSLVLTLLCPYLAREMRAYPVGTMVNSTASEGPKLIEPIAETRSRDQLSFLDG